MMATGPNALNEDKFASRLDALIDVARNDEDLSICEAIGILEMKKLDLFQEARSDEEEAV
jgi:hypothetical protein